MLSSGGCSRQLLPRPRRHWPAWATVTQYCSLPGFNKGICFHTPQAASPRSNCWHGWFFWSLLTLALRRPPWCCFHMVSPLCEPQSCIIVCQLPLTGASVVNRLEPTLTAHFNGIPSLEAPPSNLATSLSQWGSASTQELEGWKGHCSIPKTVGTN